MSGSVKAAESLAGPVSGRERSVRCTSSKRWTPEEMKPLLEGDSPRAIAPKTID
jgi:hypothetical protein